MTTQERPDPDEPDIESRTIARLLRTLARIRTAARPFVREASTLAARSQQPATRIAFTLAEVRALVESIPPEES